MNVIQMKREQTLDEVVNEIHIKFAESIKADRKADSCRVQAGQLLLDLRQRIEGGEAGQGVNWWEWYATKFVRSRRDAERVMKLARDEDPEAAAAIERAAARESMQKSRTQPTRSDKRLSQANSDEEESEDPDVLIDNALSLVASMTSKQRRTFVARMKEFGYV